MSSALMIYGANGYVGEHVSRAAGSSGIEAIVAGRDAAKLGRIASETGLERRAFGLDNPTAIDRALKDVAVVLNCAGPFKYTTEPLVAACLRSRAHYLDITGEIPVFEAIQARDAQAKARGVMLLPGVGFDVVPTDCLALHLKQRLPSATRLRLAFQSVGPAGLPPGTQRTHGGRRDDGHGDLGHDEGQGYTNLGHGRDPQARIAGHLQGWGGHPQPHHKRQGTGDWWQRERNRHLGVCHGRCGSPEGQGNELDLQGDGTGAVLRRRED
jgi:Saccharopine dehydrogenase NADP binding domain